MQLDCESSQAAAFENKMMAKYPVNFIQDMNLTINLFKFEEYFD